MADAELNARLRELEQRIADVVRLLREVEAAVAQVESHSVIIRTPGSG